MRERRKGLAEIRATSKDGKPAVTLHAIRPGVVDDYGSLWMPDAFDESLAKRMPTLCWSHDWNEPLGPPVSYRTSDQGPEVDFTFSDFDAVPQARRAHAQVLDGTIQDCSVGFSDTQRRDPTDAEKAKYPGIREVIERATLDEISLVLRGAVPGAKVLAVRSAGGERTGTVTIDQAVEVGRKLAAGEITLAEAKATLDIVAVDDDEQGEDEVEDEGGQVDDAEIEALLDEADDTLGDL